MKITLLLFATLGFGVFEADALHLEWNDDNPGSLGVVKYNVYRAPANVSEFSFFGSASARSYEIPYHVGDSYVVTCVTGAGFEGEASNVAVVIRDPNRPGAPSNLRIPDGPASPTPTPTPSGYVASILAEMPAAFWRLANPSGTVGSELLTAVGNVAFGAQSAIFGDSNGAVALDGTSYLSAPNARFLLSKAQPFTFECWFRTSLPSAGNILGSAVNLSDRIAISHYRGQIYSSGPGGSISTTKAVAGGVWHHLAYVYNGTSCSLYVDGVAQTGAGNATLNNTPTCFFGALNNGTSCFLGDLDEIAIYETALSAPEVLAHMNEGRGQ